MIQLFGKRTVKARKPVTLGPQGSAMESGFGEAAAGGGGIQPGSHPEYQGGPKLGNPIKQVGDLFKNMLKPKKTKTY